MSGPYRGKTFDLVGIPPGKSHFHSDKLERFLPSIDAHFRKQVDYIVLDVRYMNEAQKNKTLSYINEEYATDLDRLILVE